MKKRKRVEGWYWVKWLDDPAAGWQPSLYSEEMFWAGNMAATPAIIGPRIEPPKPRGRKNESFCR